MPKFEPTQVKVIYGYNLNVKDYALKKYDLNYMGLGMWYYLQNLNTFYREDQLKFLES